MSVPGTSFARSDASAADLAGLHVTRVETDEREGERRQRLSTGTRGRVDQPRLSAEHEAQPEKDGHERQTGRSSTPERAMRHDDDADEGNRGREVFQELLWRLRWPGWLSPWASSRP